MLRLTLTRKKQCYRFMTRNKTKPDVLYLKRSIATTANRWNSATSEANDRTLESKDLSFSWKDARRVFVDINSGYFRPRRDGGEQVQQKDNVPSAKLSTPLVKRFLSLLEPEKRNILIAGATIGLTSSVSLALPKLIGDVLDTALQSSTYNAPSIALLLSGLLGCQSVLIAVRTGLLSVTSERIGTRLRQRLFDSILSQEIQFFDSQRVGALANHLSNDVTLIQKALTNNIVSGGRSIVMATGGTVLLFYLSPKLAAISMVLVPVTGATAVLCGKYLKQRQRLVQEHLGDALANGEEAWSNIRVVRQFANEKGEREKFASQIHKSFREAVNTGIASAVLDGFVHLAANFSIIAVLCYGGKLIADGSMTAGDLTSFLLYSTYVGFNFSALSTTYGELTRAAGAGERVFSLIDRQPMLRLTGGRRLNHVHGELEFRQVAFNYSRKCESNQEEVKVDMSDDDVLKQVNLHIKSGSFVAFTGPSGCGKSTLIALLTQLYAQQNGQILVDGVDVQDLDPTWWRKQVGVVQQEPPLFSGTIAENIRYGRPDATDEEVQSAAEIAQAARFIEQFPLGYNSKVGERGMRLSGGQRQRIAIARVVLQNPPIVVLDEAYSALDSRHEYEISKALQNFLRGRTVLAIAHRLSTLSIADEVIVLSDGVIAERGQITDLSKQNGVFSKLTAQQFFN